MVLADFDDEAVLDRETGLVWQRSPGTENVLWGDTPSSFGGSQAVDNCLTLNIGDRSGWRVPSIEELKSLMIFSNAEGTVALPPGHPFQNLPSSCSQFNCATYWTSTDSPDGVRGFIQDIGSASGVTTTTRAGDNPAARVWCVRTGTGQVPLSYVP